jgi:predicted small lipoprotein YifL
MKTYLFTISFLLLSVFTLEGCGSKGGLITSLEDLTTESSKEGFVKVPQYRVVSIPGLLPFVEAGSLHFYKARRKPSSAIGLSADKSYVLESVIESECDSECLAVIRDKLLELRSKAEAVIEARIKLTGVIASAPKDKTQTDLHTAYQQEKQAAQTEYTKIRGELDLLHKEVVTSMNHDGLLVFRWNTSTEQSGSSGLGSLFGVSGNNAESYSGFALVSGIRIATLYPGEDLADAWPALNRSTRYSNRFELTTHVMQAQHIIYIAESDLQRSINARLSASYEQLADLPDTLKALDQIEIEATLSKVSNLSNMGVIGNSRRSTRDVDWTKPAGLGNISALDGWQTFFAVKSDLTDLMDLLTENPGDKEPRIK